MLKINNCLILTAVAVLSIVGYTTAYINNAGTQSQLNGLLRSSRSINEDELTGNAEGSKEKRSPQTPEEGEHSDIAEWMKGEIDTIKLHRAQLGMKTDTGNYYKLHKRPADKVRAEREKILKEKGRK